MLYCNIIARGNYMKCPKWLLDAMGKGESVTYWCWDDDKKNGRKGSVSGFKVGPREYPFLLIDNAFAHAEPYKEPEHEFKPFDKVLARNFISECWTCDIFSHIDNKDSYKYHCVGAKYFQCIPYEGNEKLLGTNNDPE